MSRGFWHVRLTTVGLFLVCAIKTQAIIFGCFFVFLLFFHCVKTDVIKGCDPKDPTTLQRPLNKSKLKRSFNKFDHLCVGIPKEFYCPGLSSEVVDGIF
jgi:hypothetical protein